VAAQPEHAAAEEEQNNAGLQSAEDLPVGSLRDDAFHLQGFEQLLSGVGLRVGQQFLAGSHFV